MQRVTCSSPNLLSETINKAKRGGSIVSDLLSKHPEITKDQIVAAVRTDEQAKALSTLGVNVLKLDLSDEQAVIDEISSHKSSNTLLNKKHLLTVFS